MSNDKKDLTSIEDLGEFIHELNSEKESSISFENDFPLETPTESTPESTPDLDFSLDQSDNTTTFNLDSNDEKTIVFDAGSLDFGEGQLFEETTEEPKTETKEEISHFDSPLFDSETKLDFDPTQNFEALRDVPSYEAVAETVSNQEYKAPETFSDIKRFSENSSFSGMSSEGNPSFSVLIKNVRFSEDISDILILLKELELLQDSEEQIKGRLMRGMLLVPRISEYAAILLAHKLRRFDIDIQIGLSDEIHPPKHQEAPETGIVSKFNLYQNQNHYFHFDDPKLELSQIIVSATPGVEGYQVLKYQGVATEHKMLDSHIVEDETSNEIPSHYHELAQKLKAHALKAHSNAVVGLNYQLTPIPSEYGTSGHKYRLTCTGNLVWVNKL